MSAGHSGRKKASQEQMRAEIKAVHNEMKAHQENMEAKIIWMST
jgi:hypothetical protein